VALSWCFEDDASGYAIRILEALRAAEAITPHLWTLEVANGLVTAERRGRLDAPKADRFSRMLLALPIALDPGSRSAGFREIRQLARVHRLSLYDATYLELAIRTALPLATNDSALRSAAAREGVESA
jgi:predicted nucleic acid-binding protein